VAEQLRVPDEVPVDVELLLTPTVWLEEGDAAFEGVLVMLGVAVAAAVLDWVVDKDAVAEMDALGDSGTRASSRVFKTSVTK